MVPKNMSGSKENVKIKKVFLYMHKKKVQGFLYLSKLYTKYK